MGKRKTRFLLEIQQMQHLRSIRNWRSFIVFDVIKINCKRKFSLKTKINNLTCRQKADNRKEVWKHTQSLSDVEFDEENLWKTFRYVPIFHGEPKLWGGGVSYLGERLKFMLQLFEKWCLWRWFFSLPILKLKKTARLFAIQSHVWKFLRHLWFRLHRSLLITLAQRDWRFSPGLVAFFNAFLRPYLTDLFIHFATCQSWNRC